MLPRTRAALSLFLLLALPRLAAFPQNELETFAGGLTSGFADGRGTNALFNAPSGADLCEVAILVADTGNHRIRYIDKTNTVSTVAGSGTPGYADGAALSAQFSSPYDIIQVLCGELYAISDAGNNCIRLLDLTTKEVSTLSGGPTAGFRGGSASSALFNYPTGMTILLFSDPSPVPLYYLLVADMNNHAVRRVDSDGFVTTYFGNGAPGFTDGMGTQAALSFPRGVAFSNICRYVRGSYFCQYYATDTGNNAIRLLELDDKYCPVTGCSGVDPHTELSVCTILAGSPTAANGTSDGDGTNARFNEPLTTGAGANGWMLVGDSGNRRIRGMTRAGFVGNVIGTVPVGEFGRADGTGTAASVSSDIADISLEPTDLTYSSVIVDRGNHVLRRIVTASLSASPSNLPTPSATPSKSPTPSTSATVGTSPSTSPSPSLTPTLTPTAAPTAAPAAAPKSNSSSSALQTNIAIGLSLGCCVTAFGIMAWSYVKQPRQFDGLKKKPAPDAAPESDEENVFGETALRAARPPAAPPPPNDDAATAAPSALDDQLDNDDASTQFRVGGAGASADVGAITVPGVISDTDVGEKIVMWGSRPPRPSPSAGAEKLVLAFSQPAAPQAGGRLPPHPSPSAGAGAEKFVLGLRASSSAAPVGSGGGASEKPAAGSADTWTLSTAVGSAAAGGTAADKPDIWTLSPAVGGAAAGGARSGAPAAHAEPNAGVGEPSNAGGDEISADVDEAEKVVLSLQRSRQL